MTFGKRGSFFCDSMWVYEWPESGKGWGAALPTQQFPGALMAYKAPGFLKASQAEDTGCDQAEKQRTQSQGQ